jgi:hypothetical protein
VKTIVLIVWLIAVEAFVAAAPPPPSPTADVIRRSEMAPTGTASNATKQVVGRAPRRVEKQPAVDPRASFSTEEMASITTIVRKYQPEGFITETAVVQRGPLPGTAFVRLMKRRGDRDEIVCVLTLKKEGKEWIVESCAR